MRIVEPAMRDAPSLSRSQKMSAASSPHRFLPFTQEPNPILHLLIFPNGLSGLLWPDQGIDLRVTRVLEGIDPCELRQHWQLT